MAYNGLKLPSVPTWKKWGPDVLRQEKERNPRMFARGFHMKPFSEDEKMFPHFTSCFMHGVVVGEVARRNWPVFIGVDLAGVNRPGNAIAVVAMDPSTRRRYLVEMLYGGWKSPEVAGRLAELNARHQVRFIMVENNAYQQSLVDWIRHECKDYAFWVKVESFTTGKNKADPNFGLPSLEIEFKNKAWVFPVDEWAGHPATCMCNWCHWRREFDDYPMGATWDGVMACWFAREAIDRWGGTGSAAPAGRSDPNAR